LGIHWAFPSFPNGPFSFSSRTPLGVGKGQPSDPPWTPEYMESRDIFIIISSELASSNWKLYLDFLSLSLTFSLTSFIPTFLFLFSWMHSSFQKQLNVGQHISEKKTTPLHVRSRFDPSELWTSGSHSVQKYWTSICNIRDRLCDSLAAHERPEKTEETR
jgi:hypothetical protein